ncbi:hypothetical protein C7H84_05860 [Burkholderia sp. Nafp2/4-1b]|uniref:hypothetical protein n=1 Tax=Burkholderia sp. Nafp2/4-1b TaxID=2116686 RepID=UPI000EF8B18F|nr:hypothetical protein [Burkholderia sp. Nafp2/4-1b]RKU04437.1 hypothetical protein C7H84_05860 [Burkholderia sp. Nafp2/4-1b]
MGRRGACVSAGIEGGFWKAAASRSAPPPSEPEKAGGFRAYAVPSYPGSGIKRDIPQAETPLILSAPSAASTGSFSLLRETVCARPGARDTSEQQVRLAFELNRQRILRAVGPCWEIPYQGETIPVPFENL